MAGVATHGICEGLLAVCHRDHVVVLSERILSEFAEHYIGKFKATAQQAMLVADAFRRHAEIVVPAGVVPDAFADADDLPVLGTAVAGRADCLVTGDRELLELGAHQGIPILSPRDFYDRIRESE
jgi:predicted nucleic acid-binding protein